MDSARPVPPDPLPVPTRYAPGPAQYYEKYDQSCDWIVRCDECKTLVLLDTIHAHGGCHKCGSTKMREPRTLTLWEYFKIKIGLLDFPHRAEFLAAFPSPWRRQA